ncbi:MAG: hypothetical protein GTO63_16520, partial [Anaerolineae bacterium]|nr:hypothetical protein [Anaerolineae bacterium]
MIEETRAALVAQEMSQDKIAHKLGLSEDEVEEVLAYLRDRRLIRWLPAESEEEKVFELAHEYMVNKIWVWESKEDVALKRASNLLRRELSNYQKLGLLMGRGGLEVVSEPREALSLSAEELEFVLRSTLAAGYEMGYWLERARDGGVAVEGILKGELESAVPNTRANVAKVLGLWSPELVRGEAIAWLA